jgi:hypothetical protein
MPTSHQDPEYRQLSEQAVQETRPCPVDPEDNQFEVERVIKDQVVPVSRGRHEKMITQYLVKWKGYPSGKDIQVERISKWKGYPEDDNSLVNKADIHEDLIKAYRAVQTSA